MSPSLGAWTRSAFVLLLLPACTSTSLDGTWTRPGFAGTRIEGPVLVVAMARDATVRRIYEDDMAAKLASRGVTARCSYDAVSGALDKDATDRLLDAARRAGSRYLLSTALIDREDEQVVTQQGSGYIGGGYRGWYGSYYGPAYTEVHTHQVYVAMTSLTDVAADRVEWTARTRTTSVSDVERETRGFVDVILGALAGAGLVAAAK